MICFLKIRLLLLQCCENRTDELNNLSETEQMGLNDHILLLNLRLINDILAPT